MLLSENGLLFHLTKRVCLIETSLLISITIFAGPSFSLFEKFSIIKYFVNVTASSTEIPIPFLHSTIFNRSLLNSILE